MTPERWAIVKGVLYEALEMPAELRPEFLDRACSGEDSLRKEVDSLLSSGDRTCTDFLQSPDGCVPLPPGSMLKHYEIRTLLGVGGMGEVYRGHDPRLGRDVAIKILPRAFTNDAERLRRFEQEARATAALNHPNIVAIYDVGTTDDGIPYLVSELLEGETLRDRLTGGALPIRKAVDVALQIASGLAAAHDKGIVHRDLKPENLFVTNDGRLKILDFGLAKLERKGLSLEADQAERTQPGTVMGTLGYMPPEQLRGLTVDQRSDIFAAGAIVYEMLSGKRAFQGETGADTIEAILSRDPTPLPQLNPTVPPALQQIVERCLEKDPGGRFHSGRDFAIALDAISDLANSHKGERARTPAQHAVKLALDELRADSESSAKRTAPRRGWWWAVAAVICITTAGVFSILRPSGGSTESALREVPLTSNPGIERSPSFSPDGNQIAFSWNGEKQDNVDIYVKLIGPGAPLRLTTNPADDDSPTWSPDGRTIAFLRALGGEKFAVYLIPALGGPERKLVDVFLPGKGVRWLSGPFLAWLPDSTGIIFCHKDSPEHPPSLFLFRTETYERRQLTFPPAGSDGDSAAALSPNGSTLVFARASGILPFDLYRLALTKAFAPAGEPERITHDNLQIGGVAWNSSGREIVYSVIFSNRRDGLWRMPFSRFGGRPGKPQIEPIGLGGYTPAISREGRRLAYVKEPWGPLNIWRAAIPDLGKSGGKSTPSIAPARFISSTRAEFAAQYSPDGNKIAFESDRGGSLEIWICQSDSSKCVQMTSFGGTLTGLPHWSPDGRRISFYHRVNEKAQIFTVNAEGGPSQRLTDDAYDEMYSNWSRDGRWIYFSSNRSGIDQVWKMPSAGGPAAQMTRNGGWAMAESPDGKYLYYTRSRDPNSGLWRIPAEGGPETRLLESIETHNFAVTNRGLYFMVRTDGHDKYAIRFLSFADRKTYSIAELDGGTYLCLSVSPDERWLLYAVSKPGGTNVMLVENFE